MKGENEMLQANFPNKIVYGEGSLAFLESLDMSRVVIFADKVFYEFNENVFKLMDEIFAKKHVQHWLYFGTEGEPKLDFIKENAKKLRDHQPDLIIAVGGGSVLDATKVMEVYYEHQDITDEALLNRFHLPQLRRKAKFLAIPTTSGTGSEVSPIAVIYVPTGNPHVPYVKKGIADYQMIPNYVILDPRFTMTMPNRVTVSTALDAFVHCIEGYLNKNPKNVFTDHFAFEGMRRVKEYLPKVLAEPDNLTYRAELQIAATMGGLELAGRGSGASHGSGKQLATIKHLPHGISVAVPLKEVIKLNSRKFAHEYAEIARYLGVKETDDKKAVDGLIKIWDEIIAESKCPRTISELGIDQKIFQDNLDTLVVNAQNDPAMKGNPLVLTAEEIKNIYLNLNK